MDVWKQPPESVGFSKYEMNAEGTVRNVTTKKEIKGVIHAGYKRMYLRHDSGRQKTIANHKLVALTFISEQPVDRVQVDHKNKARADNRVENLKWVSASENNKNRNFDTYGRKQSVVQFSKDGKYLETFPSIKKAAAKTGCSATKISAVCGKKQKTTGGFLWKFHYDHFGDLPGEEWKSLATFGIQAQASNLGRIKLPNNHVTIGMREDAKDTYYRIFIKDTSYSVHRLVMMAFRPRDDYESMVVDHVDENKANNKLVNLEWVTQKENTERSLNKPVHQYALNGKYLKTFTSSTQASHHGHRRNISAVCSGTQRTAYGYIWRFASEYPVGKDLDVDFTSKKKRIQQCDMEGNVIATFETITLAAKAVGKHVTNVSAAVNGKTKTAYGFKWKYE